MKTIKYTFAILTIVLLNACDKRIEIDLGQAELMIVMNSVINNDSLITVNLTRNRHILDDSQIQPVEMPNFNPEIKLFVDGEFIENLNVSAIGNGNYVSNKIAEIGRNYMLVVNEPKLGSISANSEVPYKVDIIGVDTASMESNMSDDYYYYDYTGGLECKVEFNDPAGIKNYYLLDVDVDKSQMQWFDTVYYEIDSVEINGEWHENIVEITGYERKARLTTNGVPLTSKDLAYLITTNNSLLFDDTFFDGENYNFTFNLSDYHVYTLDSSIVTINLKNISEDYFRYLKTRDLHFSSRDDFLSSPVSVFNNIEGGAGILGSYSTYQYHFVSYKMDPYSGEYEYY